MSSLFLQNHPHRLTAKTLLIDFAQEAFAVRALKSQVVTAGDLKRCLKKDPGLGLTSEEKAEIEAFLKAEGLIKSKAQQNEKAKLPPANPAICPLEMITLPLGLDGREGTNRAPDTNRSLEAMDDIHAIHCWLAARAGNRNTLASYRKEAERFLLWCTVECEIAMSSIGLQEASRYLRWLEQLGRLAPSDWAGRWKCPQHDWIGRKNTPRTDADWRPFNGALSHTSRKMAMTVIAQLFSFLQKTGYIIFNPFDQLSRKVPFLEGEGAPREFADRSFTPEQWAVVTEIFESMDDSESHARLAVILMMGKGLGMRASEMLNAQASWVVERRIDDETITVIEVIGKGDKVRRLPLQPEQVALINHYLSWRGLPALGLLDPDTCLLASLGRGQRTQLKAGEAHQRDLSRSGLYRTLETFLAHCAREVALTHPMDAAKFKASSTHWLRHTFATTALRSMPVNVVQNALGHASVGTTSRYLTPEEAEVARAMRKMKAF